MENDGFLHDPHLLMQKAKDGDASAFGQLYELYFVPVFRYIYARTKRKEDAEDLVQTVFLKVYKSIGNFQEQQKPPLAYFFSVARNAVIDYWRKKKDIPFKDPDTALSNIPDTRNNPQEVVQKKIISHILSQAITRLTEEQQEVIVLKFINELSNREIAALISKSEEAVRQLQCRALKALRTYLKDPDPL